MIIKTARLVLREFVEDDWRAVLEYQRDPRYLQFYQWTDRSEAEVRAFVRMFMDQQFEQPRYRFQLAMTLPADGRLIGNCGVRKDHPEARAADLGYEVSPEYWGQGYATEAARAMANFAFEELGVQRLWARCLSANVASARVLRKVGMVLEARVPKDEYRKGQWWETSFYAMRVQDWQNTRDLEPRLAQRRR